MIALPGRRVLVSRFSFITDYIVSLLSLLIADKSADSFMLVLLYITSCSSFVTWENKDFLFIFNFWHFNYNMSRWDSLCFLDPMSVSFPRLGKSSAIISSSTFSASLPLSSRFGTPIIWMLVCFMLFQRSLTLPLILKFLFSVQLGWFPLLCLSIHSAVLSNLLDSRFLQMYFLFHILYSSALFGSSLYFLTSCYSLPVFIHSPELTDHLYYLGLSWVDGLSLLCLVLLGLSHSFVWNVFLCLLILPNSLCLFPRIG